MDEPDPPDEIAAWDPDAARGARNGQLPAHFLVTSADPDVRRGLKEMEREARRSTEADQMRRAIVRFGLATGALYLATRALGQWSTDTFASGGTILRLVGEGSTTSNILGLTFEGFSGFNGIPTAIEMHSVAVDGQIPWGGYVYSNQYGLKSSANALLMLKAQRRHPFQYAGLHGASMGGPFALEAVRLAGIPAGFIFLNCCPFDMDDPRETAWAHFGASDVPRSNSDPFVVIGDLIATFVAEVRGKGFRATVDDLGSEIPATIARTARSASPLLEVSQLQTFAKMDLAHNARRYRKVIVPGVTQAFYCMTQFEGQDQVVKNRQAYEKWRRWFWKHFKIELVPVIMYNNPVHADPHLGAVYGRPYLEAAIQTLAAPAPQPPSVVDRRMSRRAFLRPGGGLS